MFFCFALFCSDICFDFSVGKFFFSVFHLRPGIWGSLYGNQDAISLHRPRDPYLGTLRLIQLSLNPIQDGHFRGCSRMGGETKRPTLPKICHRYPCHRYPTMMELGTVIPYFKKIQKICESRDTPLEFC